MSHPFPPKAFRRRPTPATTALGTLIAVALGPGVADPARAQTREIRSTAAFSVAEDPSAEKAAVRIGAAIDARVESSDLLRRIEPARVLSGDPKTREEETLERARAALADGRRAYDALALDDAIARLGQAVSLYQQAGPLLGDTKELQVSLTYLAAALTLRGSADEGESTFAELLTLDPSAPLDGFPPTVERVYERAVARVERAPTGSVEIYSTPPYAAVYLDGRFEGVTPLTLDDLVAGTHYLRLDKSGYTVHGAPLDVAPGQRVTSQTRLLDIKRGPEFRDLLARAALEVDAEAMGGALRTLSRELVADTLVFVTVSQSGRDATVVGAVFDARVGARRATERVVLGTDAPRFDRDLERYVDRLLAAAAGDEGAPATAETGEGAGPRDGSAFGLGGASGGRDGPPDSSGLTTPRPGPRPTPSEVYLGWTLVGLGAATMITGGAFGISALTVHGDFRDTSQGSPDLQDLRDTGQRNALVADICLISGGVLALGGTVILLLAENRAPTARDLLQNPRAGLAPTEDGAVLTFGGAF